MGGGFWGRPGGGLALVASFIYTMAFVRRCIPGPTVLRGASIRLAFSLRAPCAPGTSAIAVCCRIDEQDHEDMLFDWESPCLSEGLIGDGTYG